MQALAAQGVVVVSINYRLGLPGTACFTGKDGNWCLSDVLQGLDSLDFYQFY